MKLPIDILALINDYLKDRKKLDLVSVSGRTLHSTVLRLRNRYKYHKIQGWFYCFAVTKLKIETIDDKLQQFRNLQILIINSLIVSDTKNVLLPNIKKLIVSVVSSRILGVNFYVKLPKTVKKFKLGDNLLGYFPFILNDGLEFLEVREELTSIPDTVKELRAPGLKKLCDKKIGTRFTDFDSPFISVQFNVIQFHENLTSISLECECPHFITLPRNLRRFHLIDETSVRVKTIYFNEIIKTIYVLCYSLNNLVFPDSVKFLDLQLRKAEGNLIASSVETLLIDINEWVIDTCAIPGTVKKLDFLCDDFLVVPELPEGLKKMHLDVGIDIADIKIPLGIDKLTLNYHCSKGVDISQTRVRKLTLIYAPPLKLPETIIELHVDDNSVIEHIPDSVQNLYLDRETSLVNIPKSLRFLSIIGIENKEVFMASLKARLENQPLTLLLGNEEIEL